MAGAAFAAATTGLSRSHRRQPKCARRHVSVRVPCITQMSTAAPAPSAASPARTVSVPTRSEKLQYPAATGLPGALSQAARECASIPALFERLAKDYPEYLAVIDEHHGPPVRMTYAQLREKVALASAALSRLGLKQGQTVTLFSENSHRWGIIDQAIMAVGASAAVRGVDAPVTELLYIHQHSEAVAVIVENPAVLERLVASGLDRSTVSFVIVLYGDVSGIASQSELRVLSFEDLLAKGENPTEEEMKIRPSLGDQATLLYTSGTTGHPKGVVLTHSNIMSQVQNISIGKIDPGPGDVFVNVLPCWHVFERTAEYYCYSKAMTVVYSNVRHFREDLVKHRPHVLIAVPRVFENLYSAILSRLKKASALRKAMFALFMSISIAYIYAKRRVNGLALSGVSGIASPNGLFAKLAVAIKYAFLAPLYALANLLVWRKIRAATGGRIRVCICGGGLIAGYLEDFFESAKIEICVGYGLTETSPVICNRFAEHNVRGSAGYPLPGTDVKIVDRETGLPVPDGKQGVLFVKGPQVFKTYYRNSEATAKAFDRDGYFDTGDFAYFADKGDVVITGRSKDVIVLSNGENIEPGPIEDAVSASPYIDQVVLVGQDERALGALVVPHLAHLHEEGVIDDATKKYADSLLKDPVNNRESIEKLESELSISPSVYSSLHEDVARRNQEREAYRSVDRISAIRLVLEPFTVENGMMTQTLKIKKNVVSENLKKHIDVMFARR